MAVTVADLIAKREEIKNKRKERYTTSSMPGWVR